MELCPIASHQCLMTPEGSCSRRDGWPVRFGTFLRFIYIYVGWGGVWWDINVLTTTSLIYTTLSTHVPPTGTTLMMQHDATLTVCWGGVGWDINVLTTTSLIYTTLSTHVPPTGTTLMMQHDATLTNGHDFGAGESSGKTVRSKFEESTQEGS